MFLLYAWYLNPLLPFVFYTPEEHNSTSKPSSQNTQQQPVKTNCKPSEGMQSCEQGWIRNHNLLLAVAVQWHWGQPFQVTLPAAHTQPCWHCGHGRRCQGSSGQLLLGSHRHHGDAAVPSSSGKGPCKARSSVRALREAPACPSSSQLGKVCARTLPSPADLLEQIILYGSRAKFCQSNLKSI